MKKEELYPIQFLSNIQYRLVDCIFGNNLHYVIQSSAICMDVEDVKRYLKQLIRGNMTVGIEIIKDN